MRLTRKYIEARFDRIAAIMGWYTGPAYINGKAIVGVVMLDYVGIYGGYQIAQICNDQGGQRQLLPTRMKADVLDAWFSGVEFAKEGR